MKNFEADFADCAAAIEYGLEGMLGVHYWGTIENAPDRLVEAMQHATLKGGKRIRPLLLRQAAQVFGVDPKRSLAAQLAIELVHCYSLVHDDLPAMDNDDLRRGKPTVHKAYGEATAILVGDALLTMAFGWLADGSHGDAGVRSQLVLELAQAAGPSGMVGGQMRDIEAEGNAEVSTDDIALMQMMKTGYLIRSAVRMGAILGEADEESLDALSRYGAAVGRAFQLGDDLLDVTSDAETLGKGAGKDAARGKQTLVGRIGVEAARHHLGEFTHRAIEALSRFGPEADGLRETARYFATRTA
jgi:farnesyl diphosphate synthase